VGDRIDPDLLVGASDIAERLGFKRTQNVHWYFQHDDSFPEPVARIGSGPKPTLVWYWPHIEVWSKAKWPDGRITER
jgi:hypothetical protein